MIELRDVEHRFGDRVVLEPLSLVLAEHRIGVIGANGSGKSTFARLLNGLVVPTSGSVEVDGLDTRRHGRLVRRKVGFVFTDPDAQIVMPTVAEDLAVGLRSSGLPRAEVAERVGETLRRFGLLQYADQPAHLLSGGEKQLLALAGVLITEPETVVCDEPTTLLDLRNARMIADLLKSLRQRVILVTHHLDLLAGFERVLVFDHGRLVVDGPADVSVPAYRGLVDS
ncbi:MAG TPA: ABC transporter ATP-binding protein [Actinopolymorphaceae bacterium]